MLDKITERCYVFRADCRNNELFICEYMYICDIQDNQMKKELRYSMTPNIMYADRLHYRQGLERILEHINKDMENYEEKLKFEIVLVEFTTTVEEKADE